MRVWRSRNVSSEIEAAFQPRDVSAVRAALFDLLAEGRVSAPDLDFAPLGLEIKPAELRKLAILRLQA